MYLGEKQSMRIASKPVTQRIVMPGSRNLSTLSTTKEVPMIAKKPSTVVRHQSKPRLPKAPKRRRHIVMPAEVYSRRHYSVCE